MRGDQGKKGWDEKGGVDMLSHASIDFPGT
jgi:hypothetical protein